MAPGFLTVLSEPGNQVSLDEFHDWYNNEHIPLRLNNLPSFLSGARYQSIDGIKPSWIAAYEIDDTETFSDKSYTMLREKRSQREKDVIGKLEVLDRRTCEVFSEVGDTRSRTTGLKVGNPSGWVVTHTVGRPIIGMTGIKLLEEKEEVVKWLNEAVTALEQKTVVGWVKTRVLKVLESSKNTAPANRGKDTISLYELERVPSYFVFHEFISEESANSPTFQEVIEKNPESSPLQFSEFRRWKLYKSYPCIAQGNVAPEAED